MTPERLDQIQRRADKAHPGPWVYEQMEGRIENEDGDRRELWWDHFHDDIFIANARTDVPDLVAEVRRLQAENAELCRFRAAVSHMEQELNVLRSREMDADDIADYSEDRAKLTATIEQTKRIVRLCFDLKEKYRKEVTQLKLAKAELVEVLKKSLNIEYRTRLVCRMDFSRTQKDLEGREEALRVLLDEVKAAIAKHGGGK